MMHKISGMIDLVTMTFERLSSRERTLVAFGGLALLLFVTVMIMASVNSSLGNLEENIEILNDNYVMIDKLRSRYDEAKKQVENANSKIANNKTNLTASIGGLATEQAIEIAQINQAGGKTDKKTGILEESVKVEIRRVTLPSLIVFLETLEKRNDLFYVGDLSMRRRYDNKEQLDVSFKVTTFKLANES